MGATHRRNQRSTSLGATSRGQRHAGLSLLPFSVSKKTALGCYIPNVRRFLQYALKYNLPMISRDDIDCSVLEYLDELVEDEEVGPHRGDFVVHGLVYIWPELSTSLPRSNRALKAWHRMHVAGEGGPQPLELWALLLRAMRAEGHSIFADAFDLSLDCYLRSAELLALRADDVSTSISDDGVVVVALRLGVIERGERAKTGVRQGVVIDRPDVADMVVRRAHAAAARNGRLFDITVDAYRRALRQACGSVGVPTFPAHSARHSGPSHDASTGYRTVWQIQRRGRWASEKSVLRYMKTHALVAAQSALGRELMQEGAEILRSRPARPVQARE